METIYNQKNCITKTKSEIKKVAKKGPMKERIMRVSNFFITLYLLSITTNEEYKCKAFRKRNGISY